MGDGINDAIALQEANVSVSIRGASSVATDTAEVILMDQDLNLGLGLVPQVGIGASIGLSAFSVVESFGNSMWPLIRHQQLSAEEVNHEGHNRLTSRKSN